MTPFTEPSAATRHADIATATPFPAIGRIARAGPGSQPCSFSAEVFPVQSADGMARLQDTVTGLLGLGAEFISVTYGAGGCTRESSLDAVRLIQAAGGCAVPHISAAGAGRENIRALLREYEALDIRRLVILRGDAGAAWRGDSAFPFAADLVRFIREESGKRFHLDVAAHPESHPQARDSDADLAHFKAKIDAGADSAITQYFFNADAYEDFMNRCATAGIGVPVVPGVMPIAGFSHLARFSDAHGVEIPAWIRRRIAALGDDRASIRAFGIDVVLRLCERLLQLGAPGLHFFSLNDAGRIADIWQRLGAERPAGAAAFPLPLQGEGRDGDGFDSGRNPSPPQPSP